MSKDVQAAFLAYGQAMAKAIAVEQFLRLALMENEASKGKLSADTQTIFVAKVMRWDFGTLLQQVYQKFKRSSEFLAVMRVAKEQRDYLAHDFWIAHWGNLRTDRGLEIIVRHCKAIEQQFDGTSDYLIQETGLDAWRFIQFLDGKADDSATHAGWEELLTTAEASFQPPTRDGERH